jgi:branched-chain amino acid transport system permease protein
MILRTHNLSKHFGGVVALDDVSVEFHPGSITALVGSNGAGKSTLFNAITGLLVPDSGEVKLGNANGNGGGVRLTGLPPYVIARHGVGILFQNVRVFGKLSALENVAVGAPSQPGEHPIRSLFRRAAAAARERAVMEMARNHLEFVGLADKAHMWAEQLSYGQQKLVAIARLLAADARVLLLDEPTSGVHPDRVDALLELVQRLADDHDRTVVMIEHNNDVVARVSDRVYHMNAGRITASGTPREVLDSSRLVAARPAAQFGTAT